MEQEGQKDKEKNISPDIFNYDDNDLRGGSFLDP
jgi:hypothetical protein